MKGFLTEAALDDLAGIARYIGRDSVPVARRFTAALRRHALAVAKLPTFIRSPRALNVPECTAASTEAI